MSVTMIGLDTAKAVFQVHGADEAGKAEIRRTLRRGEVVGFFGAQPACLGEAPASPEVVLEACGAAHHWGRVLTGPSALPFGDAALRDGSLRDGIR